MKDTPAQKIKYLEKKLADEKLKNKVLNGMTDYSDKKLGTSMKKSFHSNHQKTPTRRSTKLVVLLSDVWDKQTSCVSVITRLLPQ